MLPFTIIGFRCQHLGCHQTLDQFRLECFVGRGGYRASAKGVRQRKVGVLCDDPVSLSQRVGLVGMQHVADFIQSIDSLLRVIGNRIATLVAFAHGFLPNHKKVHEFSRAAESPLSIVPK
ncbi:hypothetical protein D3C78_1516210 [compost metagenome]